MKPEIVIPAEYSRLLEDDWREAAVYGGRYSLKSHTVARILLIKAYEKKRRFLCAREFQNSIAESSMQLLVDLIAQYELTSFQVTKNAIINTQNGSDFLFRGLHNNNQSIKSIEGIDYCWVEEAQTISEESLEILTPTVRKPGSKIIYTYNRLREEDPIHKRLILEGRPNTLIINANYDIAIKYGWINQETIDEIKDDELNRPKLYKYKWLGEPNILEGRIYDNWLKIDSIPHEARLERYGLDFGYTNDPTAIVAIYYYNGGYIIDEVCYQKGLSNKQIADIISNQPKALVMADSAEPKSIDELKLYGINVLPCVKGQDSVNQGIQYVQDQKISYTAHSINIDKEYKNYMWSVDKDGKVTNKPEGLWDHLMDAARYGFESLKPKQEHINHKKPVRMKFHV